MKRSTPLKRTPLKRKPTAKKRQDIERERQARERWWYQVAKGKPCAICGERPAQGHHLISQQTLRDIAKRKGLDPIKVVWDPRGGIALCGGPNSTNRCHDRHTHAVKRVPRKYVPAEAWLFARELGEQAIVRLENEYPAQDV